MKISQKHTKTEFVKSAMILWIRNSSIIFIMALMTLGVISGIVIFLLGIGTWFNVVTPLLIIGFLTSAAVYRYRKIFESNSRLHETIEYDFDNDNLVIKGDSFRTELSISSLYKVLLTKYFLYIYITEYVAHPISMNEIKPEQMDELNGVLSKNRVKNNL